MGFKNTLELITKDIQDIENLVSNFQNYSKLPIIELDLTLSKLQNVYELLLMIRDHEVLEKGMASDISKNREVEQKDVIEEEKTSPKQEEIKEKKELIVIEKEESKVIDKEIISSIEEDTAKANIDSTSENQKSKTISERFDKGGDFLNEKLAGNKSNISDNLLSKPIESIAGSLGVNDKFYFMRELFDGKAEAFRQAVETLDKANNFNEAYNYLSNQFSWNMDSESVQSLLNLIRRKFINTGNE